MLCSWKYEDLVLKKNQFSWNGGRVLDRDLCRQVKRDSDTTSPIILQTSLLKEKTVQ